MPVTLVNGSVLLSHPADWSTRPTWKRAWQTGITPSLTGAEQRQGMRALPRIEYSYVISALSLEERVVLDECLDAASKSGLVCVPFWGRGIQLAVAGVLTSFLNPGKTGWTWNVGDYCFFQPPNLGPAAYKTFDVQQVLVAGAQLNLAGPLNNFYPAGSPFPMLWPLLFGKFTMEKQSAVTSWHGDVKVTVNELVAHDGSSTIGNVPAPGAPGVGGWLVGSTFEVS